MKKTLYILSALLLSLVACNKVEFVAEQPIIEETGLVAVTMSVEIPVLEAFTKANNRADKPNIDYIKVAVFGTSGFPQAYTLAEPVDASGNPISGYAATNGDTYYFKVLLPVYDGEAHVHIIANGDESIPFVDENGEKDEESIMTIMKTSGDVGAYWARIVLPEGILTQKDQNGIMQTDTKGNFIPSDETAAAFQGLTLVRNFAEVELINEATGNLRDITWTLVNVPTMGSVAPMAEGKYVDDFADYEYNTTTGKMFKGDKTYNGYMFPEDEMDFTVPDPTDNLPFTAGTPGTPGTPGFVYERTMPSDKATCILMRAQFSSNGTTWDTDYTYYRLDLTDENVGGYFPLYRNYKYQVKIHKVGNRGAKSPAEAILRDSGGNVSLSTEAKKLTDISDGSSRLYVEYVEKNFTSGGKKGLWVQYVPDVTTGTVDNTNVTVTIKDQGEALISGAQITKLATSTKTGYNFYEFELNDQSEENDLVSILQVKADNGETGEDKSTLFRDITLRVMKKMDMALSLTPNTVTTQGAEVALTITLPEGLPESMFPLELKIEDVNHSLYATDEDVPVKTDLSLVDGTTSSFYFIRTVNLSEYKSSNIITTHFKTNKAASATTIYVANEYFKTQHINLLNNGVYVNPASTTVAFNETSVDVEVEMADQNKTWTVSTPNGSGVTILDSEGNQITGTQTGNAVITLQFALNSSTTQSITRTATVRADNTNYPITIIQSPLEFSVTPSTQTVGYHDTSAPVTIHAGEGMTWTATVNNGATFQANGTNTLSGTGTTAVAVNFTANDTNGRNTYTVTANMTNPATTATASIVQLGTPSTSDTFNYNGFGISTNVSSGTATSPDGYVTVNLNNAYRANNNNYVRMSVGNNNGSMTVTPNGGAKITRVVITYNGNNYYESNPTLTAGTYSRTGATGTWTVNSTSPQTLTFSTNGNQGKRVASIVVYTE